MYALTDRGNQNPVVMSPPLNVHAINTNATITSNLLMRAHTAKNATMKTLRDELPTHAHTADVNAFEVAARCRLRVAAQSHLNGHVM